ncbi:hypothetical protein ACFVXE_19890 [Streptomyces sp. NPDC058231]|uniref:hypothetical protein n=1 Tax=Streptomyces sp. NPDC058231 TaxID=3346392 RepID=UPI0036E1C52D
MPLIVITALGPDDTQSHLWPEGVLREMDTAKTTLHAQLAAASVPPAPPAGPQSPWRRGHS